MANDRVIIKCKFCGGWATLAKTFCMGLRPRAEIIPWLETHKFCHPKAFDGDLGGEPGFELYTEDAIGNEVQYENQNKKGQRNDE